VSLFTSIAPFDPPALRPAHAVPEDLHPALWRAHQLGRPGSAQQGVVASGHAELDAQLPGGGWPIRVLTELLLPHAGVGELRLLAPALAALQRRQRSLMWFDPPAAPCAWALGALDIDVRQLVVVHSRDGQAGSRAPPRGRARALLPAADILWALEQALKSGHLGAALAWLPARLPADALRRLQLAAQAHDGPVFLLRDAAMRSRPSAAPLRLLLGSAGPDRLRVVLLKRRGPPLAQALHLALAPVLSATALARAESVRPPLAVSAAALAAPRRPALPA
jgi:protein ImuA